MSTEPRSPIVYLPMHLAPGFQPQEDAVPVLPGIDLLVLLGAQLERYNERRPLKLSFVPNCAIRVDADAYEAGAAKRLADRSYQSAEPPPLIFDGRAVRAGTFAAGYAIRKWSMTAMLLSKPFAFVVGPVLRARVVDATTGRERFTTGRAGPIESMPSWRAGAMPAATCEEFPAGELKVLAAASEEYFRPAPFRMDRLAVALSAFWESLTTSYPEHAYLSAAIVLEALLSTQESEITHQLAERTARLITSDASDAVDVYRRVKRLYGTRSNIVHGRGMSLEDRKRLAKKSKRGETSPPRDFSLYLHPLARIVPQAELADLTGIGVRLLREVLGNGDLRSVIQSGDDQALDKWFIELLMGLDRSGGTSRR